MWDYQCQFFGQPGGAWFMQTACTTRYDLNLVTVVQVSRRPLTNGHSHLRRSEPGRLLTSFLAGLRVHADGAVQYPDCATPFYIENFTIPLQTKQLADIAPSKALAQHGGFYFSCCECTVSALCWRLSYRMVVCSAPVSHSPVVTSSAFCLVRLWRELLFGPNSGQSSN